MMRALTRRAGLGGVGKPQEGSLSGTGWRICVSDRAGVVIQGDHVGDHRAVGSTKYICIG